MTNQEKLAKLDTQQAKASAEARVLLDRLLDAEPNEWGAIVRRLNDLESVTKWFELIRSKYRAPLQRHYHGSAQVPIPRTLQDSTSLDVMRET